MPGRKTLLSVLVLVCICYAAAPYVALWRMYRALSEEDAPSLARMVDWGAVRQGLKDDIAEGIIGMPATQMVASNGLPPFGSGFMSGIAGNVVDKEVTPQKVMVAVHSIQDGTGQPQQAPHASLMSALSLAGTGDAPCHIDRAFFDSPTSFTIRIHAQGQDPDDPPLRVRFELRGLSWMLVRVWVPQDLMERVNFRT
jgi:hypothetical protein